MYQLIEPGWVVPHSFVQDYCSLAYPKHPEGCPSAGHFRPLRGIRDYLRPRVTRECPPTKYLEDMILDYSKPLFLIWNEYEVGKDAQTRIDNPDIKLTTTKAFYNLRYWQNRARAQLYDIVEEFLDTHEGTVVDLCPEAHGVRLIEPMQKGAGIKLNFKDWPVETHNPELVKYQVCMAGYPKDLDSLIKDGIFGRSI